jgi:hypothetical protein
MDETGARTWSMEQKGRERMKNRKKRYGYQETGSGTRNTGQRERGRERMKKRTEGDGYKETGFGMWKSNGT